MDLQSRPQPVPWTPPDPFPGVIQTPRLVLRQITPDDADAYFRLIDTDRERLLPWMPWARTHHLTAEETRRTLAERLEQRADDPTTPVPVGYVERATGELIGATSIHAFDLPAASANAGWWVAGTHTGRGIATEATAHLISRALTSQDDGGWGLNKLHFDTAGSNTASRRVATRLGLRVEMLRRQHVYIHGIGLDDVYGWGVLADEWDTRNHCLREDLEPASIGSSAVAIGLTSTSIGQHAGMGSPATDHIRAATAADIAQLLRLWTLVFSEFDADTPTTWTTHAQGWFTRYVEDRAAARLPVIEVDGKVVATAVGTLELGAPNPHCLRGRTVRLANVITLPEHRRRGYGTRLVRDVIEWARSIDADRVDLSATPDGQRIYENAGFNPTKAPRLKLVL